MNKRSNYILNKNNYTYINYVVDLNTKAFFELNSVYQTKNLSVIIKM